MKLRIGIATLFLCTAACTSSGSKDTHMRTPSSQTLLDPGDPSLVDHSKNALTVWKALEMGRTPEGVKELDRLFSEEAVSLNRLPVGYSAGTGFPLPDAPSEVKPLLGLLTGKNWRGKIFCPGAADSSHGYNRIRSVVDLTGDLRGDEAQAASPIAPIASFKTFLIDPADPRNLTHDAHSNLVILNYASPSTRDITHSFLPNFVESVLQVVQVYDVMVAVKGKYGPMYIGRTWLGSYDRDANFNPHPGFRDRLIARYFLDFNPGALAAQKANSKAWPKGQAETSMTTEYNCGDMQPPALPQ